MSAAKIVEIEAESLQEARNLIKSQIDEGFSVLSEKVISDGKPKTVAEVSTTIEAAFERAIRHLPKGAAVVEKKEVLIPSKRIIKVEAFDEVDAKVEAYKQAEKTETVSDLKLILAGKRGFLGIGKTPNQYEVAIFQGAHVEVVYRTKAKVAFEIGKPIPVAKERVSQATSIVTKAKGNEHYLLKCINCDFTHHIPKDYVDGTFRYSVDIDAVQIACVYGATTVSLEVKEFFTITNVPTSGVRVLKASIRDNMDALHDHMLSHCDPLFLIILQTYGRVEHKYKRHSEGSTYVKFSKWRGTDIVGSINLAKAEIPGMS